MSHPTALTENGAHAHESTNDACLDLFYHTVRSLKEDRLVNMLEAAWKQSPLDTLKIIFYIRDCNGAGKGERKLFQSAMNWLAEHHVKDFLLNASLAATKYGRWDDLVYFLTNDDEVVRQYVSNLFASQLKADRAAMLEGKPISLCAKWAPSENGSHDKKLISKQQSQSKNLKTVVNQICTALGCNKKTYRKDYLVPLRAYSNVVEVKISANKWHTVDYEKVPSVAMNRLKKSFQKHDESRFKEYVGQVAKGEKKMNSSQVELHTLLRPLSAYCEIDPTELEVITQQWNGIVEEVRKYGTMDRAVVVSDVSGSMEGEPMQVSIALGLLVSQLAAEPYRNKVITFDEEPQFWDLSQCQTLHERVTRLATAPWGCSTNLLGVFKLILDAALMHGLSNEQLPDTVFIISDMQFDEACGFEEMTHLEIFRKMYRDAGYSRIPKVVFWNVRDSQMNNVPAQKDEKDVVLLSGFSPKVLKALLAGNLDEFTPQHLMRTAIDDKRYDCIRLASTSVVDVTDNTMDTTA